MQKKLDKLKFQGWEWEVVEMLAIKSSDDKLFDFFIYMKCEVIPLTNFPKRLLP